MDNENSQSRNKTSASNIHLPDDIIGAILSRLPVKDIHRFKSVCRNWRRLISAGEFPPLSIGGRNRAIAAGFPQSRMRSNLKPIRFYSVENEVSILKLPDPIGETPSSFGDFEFLGTCKGLILFHAEENIYIWNPSTRCCKKLSQLSVLISKFRSYIGTLGSGLWFDSRSNDYKVIFVDGGTFYFGSLSKKENWMGINFPYELRHCIPGSRLQNIGVLLNDHLYWIVKTYPNNAQLVVYFDGKESLFKETPMPKSDDDIKVVYYGLTTLDGCLCMSRSRRCHNTHDHDNDVLIMRQNGIWSTLFTIRGHLVPLQTTPSSNIAMVWTHPFIYTYNFEKKYLRKVKAKQFDTRTNRNYSFRSSVRPQSFYEPSVLIVDKGILMYTESMESVEMDKQTH